MTEMTPITLNLQAPNVNVVVHAKEGDRAGRFLNAKLVDGAREFIPPENAHFVVRYMKADGNGGLYDTMEDNETPAVTLSGNIATIGIAEQALTTQGLTQMELNIYDGNATRISAFKFNMIVEETVMPDGEVESTEYFNILTHEIALALQASGVVQAVVNMTVEAEALPAGSTPTVEKDYDPDAGTLKLTFGLVNGVDGKTAYQSAVDGGYTGTEAEFNVELAGLNEAASAAAASAAAAAQSKADVQALAETIAGNVGIDDDYTGDATTWSSNKINEKLENIKNVTLDEIFPSWQYGTFNNDGTPSSTTPHNRARCYISITSDTDIYIKHSTFDSTWHVFRNGVNVLSKTYWSIEDATLSLLNGDELRLAVRKHDDTSASFEFTDINISISKSYPLYEKVQEMDKLTKQEEDKDFEIILPSKFNMCGGLEYNIYHQNILKGINANNIFSFESTNKLVEYDHFFRYSPGNVTQLNLGTMLTCYRNNTKTKKNTPTLGFNVIAKTLESEMSKKALFIGDSLTFNGEYIIRHISSLLENDTLSLEFLGTMGTGIYKHEARTGWGAVDYVTIEQDERWTNKFWNPATEAFDFSYYMTTQAYEDVDYVFINLGTNDVGYPKETYIEAFNTIINSIHEFNSNIRIGLWLAPPRALIGNGNLVNNDKPLTLVKNLIAEFDNKWNDKLYLIPVYFNVDPYHDFPVEEVNVSARNTAYQMLVCTDKVHPIECGYQKMGDVIFGTLKYFQYLDS